MIGTRDDKIHEIIERHKILEGVSRADRFYDYRIDSNRPVR